MPVGNYDGQIRRIEVLGGREIKASPVYNYITNGITLDGSKFANGELVLEGTCLVKDNTTGKYEKYKETTAGTFEPGKSNPVILDQSVKFELKDSGGNADRIVGQVLVRADVYQGMLIGWTQAFQDKLSGAIRIL
ncbi:hypothetical protein [Paenibacillus agilis]|uniref:Uncharacterized protein n=1 Tax=Paenibacillus agilis TaxID=3020863 RepID=A0A559IX53_9BACL|nr:hypothetical protein [Paenibacillus agilis]TVX92215.1 hypothetical protein FPZ44_03570 [Paenibacillus agilis]